MTGHKDDTLKTSNRLQEIQDMEDIEAEYALMYEALDHIASCAQDDTYVQGYAYATLRALSFEPGDDAS